ncbi:helix-turn-helix domain-containing protein [Niveibacterium sp. 24ML]|uniref:helix-turn-helix domain-containing protein n=1 Tax=Niveibacterium sp. 24ML TaxID=2985512 RepID=UPI00226E479E|nr:helix-turn-helix domain-containing protein [Niveibacterium sp. 24ML]MCX9157301.1 helix-turn-helix domain-containing protein [Niveibacterium sp. 24ML]
MSDEHEYVPQMRHFQALFVRYRDQPERLKVLQSRFGLTRVAPSDTTPLPAETALQMSEWLHAAGDPHAFAWLAAELDMAAGDGLVYYLRAHDSLGAALDEMGRLAGLLFPDGRFHCGCHGGLVRIALAPMHRPARLGVRLRYESILVWLSRVLSYISGVALPMRQAELMTRDVGDLATLSGLLGITPRMAADEFALSYPAAVLTLHLPGASAALRRTIRPMYEGRLAAVRQSDTAASRVARWLAAQPDLRNLGLDAAAAALAIGASTLRRQLADEGCRFSALLAAHRARLAMDAILGSDEKTDDLAQRIGYADRNTFERAFRDRFGVTPALCRRAAQQLFGARRAEHWNTSPSWPRHSPRLPWLRGVLAEGGATPAELCEALAEDPVLHLRVLAYCAEAAQGARETCILDAALLARIPADALRSIVEACVPTASADSPAQLREIWRRGALASRAACVLARHLAPADAAALALAAFACDLARLALPSRAMRVVDGIDETWLMLASWHVPPNVLHWLRTRHNVAAAAAEPLALAIAWAEAVCAGGDSAARQAIESQIAARVPERVSAELAAIVSSVAA